MNAFLDCYFDQVFCNLDRASLMARYKRRQLVIYLKTIIEGCVRGGDCDRETAVKMAVSAAIRYHSATRSSNGAVCLMGKYHNILYVAAKLCYDWRLAETDIVVELLDGIFSCEHSFERLFVGAIFGTRVTNIISGWKSDFDSCEENVDAVHYFLEHATKARLEYSYPHLPGKTRLVDLPMESYGRSQPLRVAAQMFKADVLLLLLRFGAKISVNSDEEEAPTEPLVRQLNSMIASNRILSPESEPMLCLRILLRAVPTAAVIPEPPDEAATCAERRRFLLDVVNANTMYFHPKLREDGLIPPSRSGLTPPELKHLCRCVVRESLRQSWQLPYGIRELRIPTSLHDYLDLLED